MRSRPGPGVVPGGSALRGGADDGLICGFRFDPGSPAVPISALDAGQWISGPIESGGFIWVHFNLAHRATSQWLTRYADLSEVFDEALRDRTRSTRVEMDDDMLVAVINDVHYAFAFEPTDIATLWLLVSPRLVISARVAPLRSIDRLRHAVETGSTLRSSVDLLVRLMREQADVLSGIVRESSSRVDAIEDRLLTERLAKRRANLGALRRLLVRLQRLLAPEPAALFRLLQRPPAWVSEEDLQELRESTEEFHRVLTDMGALQERIKSMQEEIAGRVSEENNRTLFVLTMVTVLALPVNILAGLMGMNVGGVPFADHSAGFWIVVGLAATCTCLALLWVLRRRID